MNDTQNILLSEIKDWSAFNNCIWDISFPITYEEVYLSIKKKLFKSKPSTPKDISTREDHIQRIAYLVVNGWKDSIAIDVGAPKLGWNNSWIIIDGNHRLAAAFYKNDKYIAAEISGQVSEIKNRFSSYIDV